MALSSVSAFASFDLTDGAAIRDISPFLSEALIYDFHLLGHIGMSTDNPVKDVTYYWVEDALNADSVTLSISLAAADSSITFTASSQPHVGDYVMQTGSANLNQEIMQITAVNSTTNATVSRGFNATTAASVASGGTLSLIRNEQEFSDIGSDLTVNPTVRTNYTSIIPGKDLQISGSQLMREMSTDEMADQVGHQLENRMKEWKAGFTRALLYSEKVGAGSDSQYHTFGGLRYWIKNVNGLGVPQTTSAAGSFSLSRLNSANDTIVALGEYPDTLVVHPTLMSSINAIEASNRRFLESDTTAGYFLERIRTGQGNEVSVVVDSRVNVGDAFLFCRDRVRPRPGRGRALFTLAGQDWVDGKKRRILGEWGVEVRQPQVAAYFSNQS